MVSPKVVRQTGTGDKCCNAVKEKTGMLQRAQPIAPTFVDTNTLTHLRHLHVPDLNRQVDGRDLSSEWR